MYSSTASFATPYGRERPARVVLARRPLALAVDRAAGRGEDDVRSVRRRPGGPGRVPTTFTSASKSGRRTEVGTSACAARWKQTSGRTSANTPARAGSRMSTSTSRAPAATLLPLPGAEVVDDDDLVAPRQKSVDEVRADESGASCDDRPHLFYILGLVFVTFEGVDGSGKSTQARLLAEHLARTVATSCSPGSRAGPSSASESASCSSTGPRSRPGPRRRCSRRRAPSTPRR